MTKIKIAIVFFVLLLGLFLRLHNYSIYPQRGASSDEYTYSFLGVSLLTKHYPQSWSAFQAYKNRYDLTIDNLYFPMVYPYFDHPPLSGLLVGGWSILWGQDTFAKVDLKTIRLVPIFLSVISGLFLFLLGFKVYDYKTALWALLIFMTATVFAMNQRVVFAENLLTPIFLGALYMFYVRRKNITPKIAVVLGVLCGLAFWTKELGIAIFFSIVYLFISENVRKKQLLLLSAIFTVFFLGYIAYGTFYDKEVFWQIIGMQASTRDLGPQVLQLITSQPIIVNKSYADGWYLLGFLSFFACFFTFKEYKMLLAGAVPYFMLLVFSIAREGEMGWYMLPLFPFLALATARLLVESFKKKGWFIFVVLLFVSLSHIHNIYEANFGLTPSQFRVFLILIFAPFVPLLLIKNDRWCMRLGHLWFYLLILGNIYLTYTYIHPA